MNSVLSNNGKRRRLDSPATDSKADSEPMLPKLLNENRWEEAIAHVALHPSDACSSKNPSPLALACRLGAPCECVRAILQACPAKLRNVLDARGTPIHEAIVCENVGVPVIELLLRADEDMEAAGKNGDSAESSNQVFSSTRATLLQDVDGFTPLHLLIRRRFQAHILNDETASLMQILELLVRSCPEAVLIPDLGEYEEPPVVYALKANIYAPALVSDEGTVARVERQIYEMVACMLKYCPKAASQVFSGYRGQYTALHSAVFHGRDTSTIELLLRTEAEARTDGKTNCVLANTQGELPLHFCAMRGERPRSVALIAAAAPEAVIKRDATGLTPMHWLWARFVSALLTLDRLGLGDDNTVGPLSIVKDTNSSPYSAFSSLEQGDFELDLQLIRRMDPPVDFLRMRHIPIDVMGASDSTQWADQTTQLLNYLRERYECGSDGDAYVWSRRECVVSLFWTKVVSLIQASAVAIDGGPLGNSVLVHSAFASPACLPAIARIVSCLYPDELTQPDERGRLPVHYAASRLFHEWDWPCEHFESCAATELLKQETLSLIEIALDLSPPEALAVTDLDGRLPLHIMIDNIMTTCSRFPLNLKTTAAVVTLLEVFVKKNQVSLQRCDGRSKLYPFLQATAAASEHCSESSSTQYDHLALSITYQLMRENPETVITLREQRRLPKCT
ncbi:hypothetical protein ACA910_017102 [Epithemia clementina (nom. ined.)]